jgi:hypothetical protein
MSLSEAVQKEQVPYTGKTRCCTGHRVPGYGLSLDRVPVSEEAPLRRSVVRASRKRMDTSTVCRGVSERARAGDNKCLGTNPHFSTVVKGDVEVPGEVPAKNGFRT